VFAAGPSSIGGSEQRHTEGVITMQNTIFVTGGAGGLGSATVDAFLASGWRVVAPVRPGGRAARPAGGVAVVGVLANC
jgi:NAD(P)-dependent dehydrogenase (short-subunit alcohol dehydrogenase family)